MLNRNYIGIDIGYSTIRIIELTGKKIDKLRVKNYIKETAPDFRDGVSDEDQIAILADIIKKMHTKLRTLNKRVAISLPMSGVIKKSISLPCMPREKIYSFALNEIKEELPGFNDKDELVIENRIRSIDRKEDEMLVDIYFARLDMVSKYESIVKMAGLKPVIIDAESNVIRNGLYLSYGDDFFDKKIAVLDMGSTSLRLFVFNNGDLYFEREGEISGLDLNNKLMEGLGVGFKKSEEYKHNQLRDAKADLIKQIFLSKYIQEAVSLINAYQKQTDRKDIIDDVVLIGGFSDISDVEMSIKKDLYLNQIKLKGDVRPIHLLYNTAANDDIRKKIARDASGSFIAGALAYRMALRGY